MEPITNVGQFIGDPDDRREGKQDEYADGEYMLPKFSGAQGGIIRKSLKEMEDNFIKSLKQIQNV